MPPRLRASIKRSASPGRPIGYAREGAGEQSLALQLAALQKAGCAQVFTDQARGAGAGRPGLNDALSQLRPGDTLVVWNLGRLGGGVKGLVDLVNALAGREAHFRSLSDDIDTQASAGRFFFHVMARLAQMERELIALNGHLEDRVQLRTAELELNNRDLNEIGEAVASELRSPLNAIKGFASDAIARDSGTLSGQTAKDLDCIRETADRASVSIDEFSVCFSVSTL